MTRPALDSFLISDARPSLDSFMSTPTQPTGGAAFAASADDNPLEAGLKAVGNLPGSVYNFGKGIYDAARHPVDTAKGLGSVAAGGVQKLIPGQQGSEEAFNAFSGALKDRYGSLENLQKTATEDPFGFGSDVMSVLTGGAALAGKSSTLARAIPKVSSVVTNPASKLVGAADGALPKLLSYTSDVPEQAFKTMLERREPVSKAIKAGTDATTALKNTQSGVRQLRKTLSAEWQESTVKIADEFKNQRLGFSGKNVDELVKLSDEFGFDIPQNPSNASALEWIDTLKSMNELPKLMLTVSPKGAKVRRLQELVKTAVVKRFGGKGGSVDNLYKNYASKKKVFDAANDIVKAYSEGKPITQTTASNRLQNIFDENKPAYLEAILDLEKATGQDLLSQITASKFKKVAPNNMNRLSSAGGMATPKGLIEKGINLLLLPLTSPRMAGFISRNARVPNVVSNLASDVNNFRIPATLKNREGQLKMGLSTERVTPESVAKKVDSQDIKIIKDLVGKPNINSYIKAQPMLEAMGIQGMEEAVLNRFLREVLEIKR